MNIAQHDEFILSLDDSHPAKRFFIAFCECRDNSVGRHHDWTAEIPIEQAWVSADGKGWLFSEFAYIYLSISLILDGCRDNNAALTENEVFIGDRIPVMRTLMNECSIAAKKDKNVEILVLTKEVIAMLELGEEYLRFRKGSARSLQ